jgi:predicted NBD/HSP70 family sugar kinase
MSTTPVAALAPLMLDPSASAPSDGRSPLVAGVDLGATKIAVLIVDGEDRVVGEARRSVPDEGSAEALIAAVTRTVQQALEAIPHGTERLAAVGIGAPGRIDPIRGTIADAVNLGVRELELGPAVGARLGVTWAMENDVRAAALGIAQVHPDIRDIAYVNVGTGVGAGVVLDGRLHRGGRGIAGEVGHIVVADGPRCRCGQDGCVEAVVAGPAIVAQARAAGADGIDSASDVFLAAAAGDPTATPIVDRAGRILAGLAHTLVLAYDLERVVFGGGVTAAGDAFLAPILRELERRREASTLVREVFAPGSVRAVDPGHDAGCRGAIAVARRWLAGTPTTPARKGGDAA